jgi:ribosomal protein S18 acetylase RimI-like enzyme
MEHIEYEWVRGCNAQERIRLFLLEVDSDFIPVLSERVDIKMYAKKLAERAENLFVVVRGENVASCSVYCNEDIAFISSFAVKKKYWMQHIGSKMMGAVKKHAVSCGCSKIRLEVGAFNCTAKLFYENCGFLETEHHTDWIIMELVL